MSRFSAAIKLLDDAVVNKKTSALYRPAQRVLEAAAKVDKKKAMSSLFEEYGDWIKSIYELIDSLPEEDK